MPITPVGRLAVVVVTVSCGAVMTMLRLCVAVFEGDSESVTVTVKMIVPTAGPVGLPVIEPVLEFKLSPTGRLPVVIDQLKGEMPPAACSVVPAA